MRARNLKIDREISQSQFENIWSRLKLLEHTNPEAFCRLVKSCRNPEFELKLCVWTVDMCRNSSHHDCKDIKPYLGLVKSLDDHAHAEIDPVVRAIVLASTPALQMPRVISPLAS